MASGSTLLCRYSLFLLLSLSSFSNAFSQVLPFITLADADEIESSTAMDEFKARLRKNPGIVHYQFIKLSPLALIILSKESIVTAHISTPDGVYESSKYLGIWIRKD